MHPTPVLKRISDRVDLGNIVEGISAIYNQHVSSQRGSLVGFQVCLIIESTQDVIEVDFFELCS